MDVSRSRGVLGGHVEPVSEWPQAGCSCLTTAGQWKLMMARRMMWVVGWQGFNADTLGVWQHAMESLYCEDAEETVAQAGFWSPRSALVEHNKLQHPAFNSGVLKWEDFRLDEETARCDDERGIITFRISGALRLRLGGQVRVELIKGEGLFSLVFRGHCIRKHYAQLPKAFSQETMPIPPPQTFCSKAQQLCGSSFPYADVHTCASFLSSLPGGCRTNAFRGNTMACRTVQLVKAFQNPEVHCPSLSESSVDPVSGKAECGQGDCDDYIQEGNFRDDLINCYTEASSLNTCLASPFSQECCSALRTYDLRGCFCDATAMQDLPSALRQAKLLSLPCNMTLQTCSGA